MSKIKIAVKKLLDLAIIGPSKTNDIGKLAIVLDELAWLSHRIQLNFDETEYPEPPRFDSSETYTYASKWIPNDNDDSESSYLAFIAAMDFSEIIDDFRVIEWRFNNTSESDALFHYQLGYQSHWGHHMRSLQKFIHNWYW
ncbi:MAG: hypothetical protein IAE98_11455 [Candidatus Kapabacteria bacterium]|nr:hypothetical protein [Candidatus Kapabacteria bacterium]